MRLSVGSVPSGPVAGLEDTVTETFASAGTPAMTTWNGMPPDGVGGRKAPSAGTVLVTDNGATAPAGDGSTSAAAGAAGTGTGKRAMGFLPTRSPQTPVARHHRGLAMTRPP